MIDVAMLRDQDDGVGFYAAVSSAGTGWPGASLYGSDHPADGYVRLAHFEVAATMGVTLGKLQPFGGGNVPDESNRVDVRLTSGTLASTDYAGLLAGALPIVIGREVLCYRSAQLIAADTYRLSGFLRARRGTENMMGTHAAGERFILLNPAAMARVSTVTADIGRTRYYKAVTDGAALSSAVAHPFAYSAAGLTPYAPAHLGGGRDGDGNAVLQWTRRTRVSGEWRDFVGTPLGEAFEAYEVEIWNEGFTALKRTITGLTTPRADYSAAQQAADFGAPQSSIYFRVYQLNGIVGRGYGAAGRI